MKESKASLQQIYPKRVDIVFLILASLVLLVMGLSLPLLTVRKLWEQNTYSIISGIGNLWNEEYYVLAFIIFVFSVVFPIVKLIALSIIWFIQLTAPHRKFLLYWMGILGKWSMLDVFVAAVIIVWVRLGVFASAQMEKGVYFFCLSIFLAMVATALQNYLTKKSK